MAKPSKQSYENKWQKAFEDAQMQPSAQLWKNIESDLNAAENAKFKRRILFYRMATAAAVACLVVLGIYTWNDAFVGSSGSEQEVAVAEQGNQDTSHITSDIERGVAENSEEGENADRSTPLTDTSPSLAETTDNNTANVPEKSAIADNESPKLSEGTTPENEVPANGNPIPTLQQQDFTHAVADNETLTEEKAREVKESIAQAAHTASDEKALAENFERQSLVAAIPAQGVDNKEITNQSLNTPVDEIYPIPIMPKNKNKDFKPTFFAGLNLSTDYFNPNYNAGLATTSLPNSLAEGFQNVPDYFSYSKGPQQGSPQVSPESITTPRLGEENTAQISFSYGMNFGMAISEHWSIESGLAYSKYNTSSETSVAFQGIAADEAYPVSLANSSTADGRQFSSVRYEETTLTNTFDFVAVPMKIGYNLHFDRISVVFGTGVAANFLLQNSISDDAGQLNEVTIRPDESGPFRKVYYSGILSGGIHYQLVEKYSFSITPSYNFSISSLTKSESAFMSLPYFFGINFGIRYQF